MQTQKIILFESSLFSFTNKNQILLIFIAFSSVFVSLSLFFYVVMQESNGQLTDADNTFSSDKIGNIFDPLYYY